MTLQETIIADLSAIFADGFTVTATHTYGNGSDSEDLNVLFQTSPDVTLEESGGGITTALPSILLLTSDAGNIDRDSSFAIGDSVYYVLQIEQSVEGVTRIWLSDNQAG